MATTQRELSIHDTVPAGPPVSVRAATAAWFLAVGAGVAESGLGVIGALGDSTTSFSGLVPQIALRAIVYGGLFVVIDKYFRLGRNWSRQLLAILLGVIGMATLVVGPILWLLGNGDLGTVDFSPAFVGFAAIRTVHVMAVLTGMALMYQPDANRWFHSRNA
jgi:hypothetical protein